MNDANLKIIIAGPGAGKTYSITSEVLRCLPYIEPNRYCAVVTYTNAATEEIRTRISNEIKIQSNLFVGTIHSFLIHFILDPFAHLLKICEIEKSYIDRASLNTKTKMKPFIKKNIEKNLAETLLKKGVVTFDQILNQAFQIIHDDENISRIISNRLQYVFIDEYQDSRLIMHAIVKKLCQNIKSNIYCIGDPLQSIYNFTYTFSQIKKEPAPKTFNKTPMMDFISNFPDNISNSKINYRSSTNIVNVVNNFIVNPEFKQTSSKGDNQIPVYFITDHDKKSIIRVYEQINMLNDLESIHKRNCERNNKSLRKILILTREWNQLATECNENGISELPKDNHKSSNHLTEVARIILGILGLKKSEAIFYTKDEITFRKFCFEILRFIKSSDETNINHDHIKTSFEHKFNCMLDKSDGKADLLKSLEALREKRIIPGATSFYSAIHSSKGLESTSVLACAQTENELLKWLNYDKANSEMDDDFRLGYVAFSRARDILCISCLKPIVQQETTDILRQMNVTFTNELFKNSPNMAI